MNALFVTFVTLLFIFWVLSCSKIIYYVSYLRYRMLPHEMRYHFVTSRYQDFFHRRENFGYYKLMAAEGYFSAHCDWIQKTDEYFTPEYKLWVDRLNEISAELERYRND